MLQGAALNLAARGLAVLLGLAILVLVARRGPAVQGAFALFVAIEAALLTLCSGLGLLLAREASQRHGALPQARVRRLLAIALLLGLVAALVLAGWAWLAQSEPYRHLWLLALAAPALLMVPTATGLWMGQGRLLALNLPQVAAPAIVVLILLFAGRADGTSAIAVLAAWAAAKGLVGLVTGWAAARAVPAGVPAPERPLTAPAPALRFVLLIGLTNLVSLLNFRATLFLLERVHGLEPAGVYSVAVQVAELLWLLSSAVTVSAYGRIGAPDPQQAARLTLRAVRINLLATLAAAPLLALAAWWLLPRVLGAAYADALLPLLLLLPGVAGYAAASSLSAWFTNQRGRPQWSAAIAGLSLALTLAIAAFTVPRYGAAGAALATSVAFLVAIAVALRSFLADAGLPWSALWARPQ
ncbi:O-antigen/teichoic acid export membrane protein [Rivibacter subsaxonicus]|uniref:O-antigen/teichoic acid export membrane protein n=1 Tax=Rivibacter subsaxonicus TaxID=457575 RepID=A0A4Q7VH05_9BURK|nr:O-antigen/teichoic acid export membrane protein [Rivibacter subsaxonicus]